MLLIDYSIGRCTKGLGFDSRPRACIWITTSIPGPVGAHVGGNRGYVSPFAFLHSTLSKNRWRKYPQMKINNSNRNCTEILDFWHNSVRSSAYSLPSETGEKLCVHIYICTYIDKYIQTQIHTHVHRHTLHINIQSLWKWPYGQIVNEYLFRKIYKNSVRERQEFVVFEQRLLPTLFLPDNLWGLWDIVVYCRLL